MLSQETAGELITSSLIIGAAVLNWLGRRKTHRQLIENTEITKQTHDIANGEYTVLLQEIARAKRRIASMSESPQDLVEAEVAETILRRRLEVLEMKRKMNNEKDQ